MPILQEVQLKEGLRPGVEKLSYDGFIDDLALVSKNGQIGLCNFIDPQSFIPGTLAPLEMEKGI